MRVRVADGIKAGSLSHQMKVCVSSSNFMFVLTKIHQEVGHQNHPRSNRESPDVSLQYALWVVRVVFVVGENRQSQGLPAVVPGTKSEFAQCSLSL